MWTLSTIMPGSGDSRMRDVPVPVDCAEFIGCRFILDWHLVCWGLWDPESRPAGDLLAGTALWVEQTGLKEGQASPSPDGAFLNLAWIRAATEGWWGCSRLRRGL
jgi:hypothetical protein